MVVATPLTILIRVVIGAAVEPPVSEPPAVTPTAVERPAAGDGAKRESDRIPRPERRSLASQLHQRISVLSQNSYIKSYKP